MNNWDEKVGRKYEKSLEVGTFLGGFILATLTGLIALGSENESIFCTNTDQTNITQQTSSDTEFCKGIVNVPNPFGLDYKQIFIGAMGLVGTLFIVSIYGMKTAYVHRTDDNFSKSSHILYESGFVGILILFPLIVMPFSLRLGIVIAIVASVWIVLYGIHRWKERLKSHRL